MTFDSSNREELESRTTNESLVEQIRIAMGEGGIRPCRVFDMVDEALDRLEKQEEALKNAHEFLRKYINCSGDFKTKDVRGLADELWDVIHRGDEDWREVHNWRNKGTYSLLFRLSDMEWLYDGTKGIDNALFNLKHTPFRKDKKRRKHAGV